MSQRGIKKRILFFSEAVSLAHVARPWVLAHSLDTQKYEIAIASDPRFNTLFPKSTIRHFNITTLSSAEFAYALSHHRPPYSLPTLIQYTEADLKIIDDFKPDLIIGDFRLSLSVSARLRKIPYWGIMNSHWIPAENRVLIIPNSKIISFTGKKIAQKIFDIISPHYFKKHLKNYKGFYESYGQNFKPQSLQEVYFDADKILLSDIPSLAPENLKNVNNTSFLGPISWSPELQKPDWWPSFEKSKKSPKIYVSLGSSGQHNLLPLLIKSLAKLNGSLAVGTLATKDDPDFLQGENIFYSKLIPGDEASSLSDIVICNGGSGACYQALSKGKPILAIPNNLDQFLNISQIKKAGAGEFLRLQELTEQNISKTIISILNSPSYYENAKKLQIEINQYNSISLFKNLLDSQKI